jgi:hypothetical protein
MRLARTQPQQTGWDVFPTEASAVERGLDVRMDLEHHRKLVRQGNDRRSPSLTSQALLTVGVKRAARNAAVLGRRLLHACNTSRTSADLERSGLLQTVSDLHCSLQFPWSLPRPFPGALLIIRAASAVSSVSNAYAHRRTAGGISWGKNERRIKNAARLSTCNESL